MRDCLAGEITVLDSSFFITNRRPRPRRPRGIGFADLFDSSEKAVSATRDGFYIPGLTGGFRQGIAQPLDGRIDAVVELHDGVVRPQPEPDLLAEHHFAGLFEQEKQDLKRLFPELDANPVLAQLAGTNIEFERSETDEARFGHGQIAHEPSEFLESTMPFDMDQTPRYQLNAWRHAGDLQITRGAFRS